MKRLIAKIFKLCPECLCKRTVLDDWHDEYGLVEYCLKCKKCCNVKELWSYGQMFIKKWKKVR